MDVGDLTHELRKRSLGNINSLSLKRGNDDALLLSLKAYGYFAPGALEVAARLLIHTLHGEEIAQGRLRMIAMDQPRGVWFHYVFVPNHPPDVAKIVFWGVNQFSNVEDATIIIEEKGYRIRNPFFRKPPVDAA